MMQAFGDAIRWLCPFLELDPSSCDPLLDESLDPPRLRRCAFLLPLDLLLDCACRGGEP